MKKPSKYDPQQQTWYNTDIFKPKCQERVVICDHCRHLGHVIYHLNQNVTNDKGHLQVIKRIQHSHFLHETDRARHIVCVVDRFFVDPEVYCDKMWRLKPRRNMPDWVREELYGKEGDWF